MKVQLEIENIGGLRGKQTFEFERGKVNIVESPNAAGKTSLIKGLAAALSLPCKSSSAHEEAMHLGLRASSASELEPLINIYENQALIRLQIDVEERLCRFTRWKEPIVKPEGNEKFVFAGLLTRESKVVRHLAGGNDDFIWIVDIMSFARRYEEARGYVEKALTEALIKSDEIKKKNEELTQLRSEIKRLEQERLKIKEKYESLERELKLKPPEDLELRARFEKLAQEERNKAQIIENLENEIRKLEEELIKPRMELYSLEREIRSLEQARDKKLKELESLPTSKEVKEWLDKADAIEREDIPNLREERGKKVGIFNLIESALQVISGAKKVTCPLCGSTDIDAHRLANQKEELKKEIAKLDRQIGELLIQVDKLRGETIKIGEKREDYKKELSEIESHIHDKETHKNFLQKKMLHPERQITGKREELKGEKDELERIRKGLRLVERDIRKTEAERESLIIERERLGERLQNIDDELEREKSKAEERSWIMVRESPMPIDKATKLYEFWAQTLDGVIKHIDMTIKDQRKGAARRFNGEVKNLVTKLGFTEFQDIILNEESYRLQVFRKGGRAQAISSLSSSERNALATLLQLAMKEAYVPEIPFFIIDEVVLDFDKRRVEEILEYLSYLAKERGWSVIVTRLAGEGAIKVKQV